MPECGGSEARQRGLAALAVLALSACTQPQPSGQVLARVGTTDVTVQQLNSALESAPLSDRVSGRTRAATLQGLVDTQLLAQGALDAGLDRRPEIAEQIAAARAAILARAYVREGVPLAVSAADRDAFYKGHPLRYAERRRYWVRVAAVGGDRDDRLFARSVLSRPGEDIDDAVRLLQPRFAVRARRGSFTTDEVPAALLATLPHVAGQTLFRSTPDEEMLIRVDRIAKLPRSRRDAEPELGRLVLQERLQKAWRAKLDSLHATVPVVFGDLGEATLAEGRANAADAP